MKRTNITLMLILSIASAGHTNIIVVPDDRPTIQSAINSAMNGDTVLVREGLYKEFINFDGKQLVVGSFFLTTGDTAFIGQTILSVPSKGAVVTFESGETELTRLVGFTIFNGWGKKEGATYYGGGIYCSNAHPVLEHLQIRENRVQGLGSCGGGIYFRESHAMVRNCRIEQNEATYGAGIRCDGSDITIVNTWFHNNFAVNAGGGVMFYLCQAPRIQQCTFTQNSGIYGGAICCNGSNPVIDRVTSFKNSGGYGGTLNCEASSHPKLINSIFWQNSINPDIANEIFLGNGSNSLLVAYSDILGGDTAVHIAGYSTLNWLEGNIQLDPEFRNPITLDLSLPEDSPCVNAGTALFIYEGDTLVVIQDYSGSSPDMGAFECLETVHIDPVKPLEAKPEFQILAGNSLQEIVIRILLPANKYVILSLIDMSGKEVYRFADQPLCKGEHRFKVSQDAFPKGIYLIRMVAGRTWSSKQLLVR